jgi:diguanylate cyclase (GGDEF)-like protein
MITRQSPPGLGQVLVVEDNPSDARYVQELLRMGLSREVEVACVDTLEAATRHVAGNTVTCVLLDLSLPDAQGLEGLEALHAVAPQVPIVVLSGQDDESVALRAVQSGAQDYLMKSRVDELLVTRAVRYAVERKRAELELLRLALHDSLTGLPNRALFLDRLEVALARSRRLDSGVAVLFVDIDRFKVVNDSLGHQAGDRLLSLVAARLSEQVETGDTVARFGGDEFALLCTGMHAQPDAVAVAERVAQAVSAPFTLDESEVFLTTSVGIAVSDDAHQSAAALVRDADAAMHRAKERGRSRHELFDQVMRTAALRRLETENALHRALQRRELRLHYQPEISLADGRITGFEALVRWDHPHRGLLSPAEFIPLAEETGLIIPVGAWVIDEACAKAAQWRSAHPAAELAMSVNLSARQLQAPGLVDHVEATLNRHSLPAGALVLEITESLVVAEDDRTRECFAALRELGVRIAVDDFGTGYASLAALKQFPADLLKIDRAFVAGLGNGSEGADGPIVAAVVALARALDLVVIAEGIERPDQHAAVRALGCDLGQGFLFAPPMPAEAIPSLLG